MGLDIFYRCKFRQQPAYLEDSLGWTGVGIGAAARQYPDPRVDLSVYLWLNDGAPIRGSQPGRLSWIAAWALIVDRSLGAYRGSQLGRLFVDRSLGAYRGSRPSC